VVQHDVAGSDRGEDVSADRLEPGWRQRRPRWGAQGLELQPCDLEQRRVVEEGAHLVDVLRHEREPLAQLGNHCRIGAGLDLEPDDRLEAPLQHLALDKRPLADAVVLFVGLDLGVAADSEQTRLRDRHPREELGRVSRDHFVEADEHTLGRRDSGADAQPLRQFPRHLDSDEHRLTGDRILESEGPRGREVRHVRERMRFVETERRQDG
jgi:hypothetical protein